MNRAAFFVLAITLGLGASPSIAADDLDGIRGPTSLMGGLGALPSPTLSLPDERQARTSYSSPPVIPHSIRGFALDAKSNECLSCHGRTRTVQVPGPPISISHFVERDGQVLASVAPSRYFCTECHLPQLDVKPPVGNTYKVLSSVPYRRHLCMECHFPQIEAAAPAPASAAPQ